MRGRDIAGVIEQYTKFVKPAFDTFVAPSRKHADVIIPWGRRAPPSASHARLHSSASPCTPLLSCIGWAAPGAQHLG